MKKIIYFFIAAVAFHYSSYAQYTAIPDGNFEQKLISGGIDTNPVADNQILTADAMAFTGELNIANSDIADISGIEAFLNITGINFNYNPDISSVNLSNNTSLLTVSGVGCANLASVNVSGLANLTTLNLRSCGLTSIDLSTNVALETLNLRKNNLVSLDLSQNVVVKDVDLKLNNLSIIDIRNGNQANMLHFDCDGNSSLTCMLFDDASLIDRDAHIVWFIDDLCACLVDNETECTTCLNTLNTNETAKMAFNMYPNPVNGALHIESYVNEADLTICSITGKVLLTIHLTKNDNIIDVSGLASGMYLARFSTEHQLDTKKLMIK
ncbi:T9SS type A sorting domain-containing protein [Xanthomarina gelatinilytica]|uniref:T9SS type A sorting domain-containing protein n=1 Tax=Xanthomarina gelatinilytica TaxID=1137281 RepID=UPI003AA7AE37